MDEDAVYHVGVKVADMPIPVKGCVTKTCFKCEEKIWVSPASLKSSSSQGLPVKYVCVKCARPHISPETEMTPITQGQVDEFIKALEDQDAKRKKARLN